MERLSAAAVGAAVGAALVYALLREDDASRVRAKYAQEWEQVTKNEKNRVEVEGFVEHCLRKNAALLTPSSQTAYLFFLRKCFDAATGLMLPAEKTDLGRHCFSYAALFADEFYFAAAQNAADSSCGCNTPVADVVGLVSGK